MISFSEMMKGNVMDRYEGIVNYLRFITEVYGIDICINDFTGFLQIDHRFLTLVQPYLIHKSPFCMAVKSNQELWDRCLHMKQGILQKSRRVGETFYGMCYCGMEEFIRPVLYNDTIIGFICAGGFCTRPEISHHLHERISKRYALDKEELCDKFEKSVRHQALDIQLVNNLLGIVAEYFSQLYAMQVSLNRDCNTKHSMHYSTQSYILSHAIQYIREHYEDKITVEDVASFCHCSVSYMNHTFKKHIKMNIKAYINQVRLEQAQVLLLNSSDNIREIALKVGFSDPNYFSSVFGRFVGKTPTEFKKMNTPI